MRDVFETFVISNVIDDDDTMCSSIVTVGDGTEALLTCSVPLY